MGTLDPKNGLTLSQRFVKRTFDVLFASFGIASFGWLMLLVFLIATIDTRRFGLYRQMRIGKNGRPFGLLKIRTMREAVDVRTTVTTASDPRITSWGRVLRRTKLDELPQLFNVLWGDMSFVGPRPDVSGFADELRGEDRVLLMVRPGITGPASVEFADEEELLALQDEPEVYNREVIFPRKVQLNREYVQNYSLSKDIRCLLATIARTRV